MSCIHVVQHLNTTGNTATTPFPSLIFQNLKHTSYVVHKRFCVLLHELKTFKKNIYSKYLIGKTRSGFHITSLLQDSIAFFRMWTTPFLGLCFIHIFVAVNTLRIVKRRCP